MIKKDIPDDIWEDEDEIFLAPLPPAEVSMKKYGNTIFKGFSIENRRVEKLKHRPDYRMTKTV